MKKNNIYYTNDEVDLSRLIRLIYKKKFYILFLSTLTSLLFYFYSNYKNNNESQNLKVVISIRNPTSEIFAQYSAFIPQISLEFSNSLFLNLSSSDNLDVFLEQSKSFDDFKMYLKSINSTAKEYFSDSKFTYVKLNNGIIDKLFLIFPKKFDGKDFLKKYIEFNKNKTITEFKKRLKTLIEYEIEKIEQNIEIAKISQIEEPILFNNLMIYKGNKILSQELINLKKLLSKLKNEQFNYDHILSSPILEIIDTRKLSSLTASIIGFFFGLFFCIFVLFFKDYLKK